MYAVFPDTIHQVPALPTITIYCKSVVLSTIVFLWYDFEIGRDINVVKIVQECGTLAKTEKCNVWYTTYKCVTL